ncbi:MAG TPA: SCO family protein [Blastocatellia bacterium]|nr:SCO family protein [Blastocatellia bacterium]
MSNPLRDRRLIAGRRSPIAAAILLVITAGASCRSGPTADEQRYELKGKVVSVDKRGRTVTIAHEAIPDLMEAMTMPFTLKQEWAYDELAPGDRVQATLVVQDDRSWLEALIFVREEPEAPGSPAAENPEPEAGAEVPDFTLINQGGKRIRLRDYRGRALIVTFIYTRCPLPDYCPLMTERMGETLGALDAEPALAARVHLLSISVDPEYDNPARLRDYGRAAAGLENFDRWEFASGSTEEVRKVAGFFGLSYWTEGDQIIHSLRTAVIGPDGKIARLHRGNEWTSSDIIDDLRKLNLE